MHLHESTKEISRQIIKSSSIRPLSNRKQKTTYTGHIETLKNIILADNLKYMGYKIKFHALLFRFGPTGILENRTISQE